MKALALFSGGCDSLISMKLIKDQGIDVVALNFNIGFGGNRSKLEYLKNATAQIGVDLEVVDIRKQFFNDVLFTPKYGYGRFFNPCIDCHANMFINAFEKLLEHKASFIISGEVLGQRPKSQRREALDQVKNLVAKFSLDERFSHILSGENAPKDLGELILRPMSAKLLPPTYPEKMGWVNRENLLDISGRGRSRQLNMIKEYGWKYFENPGGGCLLTDTNVSLKLKDLSSHREMVLEDIEIVKVGRYMVLPEGARLVVARNEVENAKLDIHNTKMDKIELLECDGPLGVVDMSANESDRVLAGMITLGYGRSEMGKKYKVRIGSEDFLLEPLDKQESRKFLLCM